MEQDRDDIGIGMDCGLRSRLQTGCLLDDAKMSRFLGQEEQIVGQEEKNVVQGEQNWGGGGIKMGAESKSSFFIPI